MKRQEFHQGHGFRRRRCRDASQRRRSRSRCPRVKWRTDRRAGRSRSTRSTAPPRCLAKAVGGSHRRQIPDPDLRRGRNRPRPAGRSTPCRTAPSRWGHTASYYYFGKDPTFALRHVGALRSPTPRIKAGLVSCRAAARSCSTSSTRSYNVIVIARRQYRLPDGRLVPQGDQARSTISRD